MPAKDQFPLYDHAPEVVPGIVEEPKPTTQKQNIKDNLAPEVDAGIVEELKKLLPPILGPFLEA